MQLAQGAMKPKGVVLDDLAVQAAMDKAVLSDDKNVKPRYIPVDRQGNPKGKTKADFDAMEETISEALRKGAVRILTGECSAKPIKQGSNYPCSYCSMKPVCRAAKE